MYKLSVVVPVYNEEKNITPFLNRMLAVISELGCFYEIIFILDPCSDNTEHIITEKLSDNNNIKLLIMSRRFGQPACTIAGIHYCSGDICVAIDVDLQDPPEFIADLIKKWQEGYDVVCAQRRTRKGETWVKRVVSYFGYWLIDKISDVKIPRNTGDFRLMTRKVIDELKKFKEHDAFLRGLVAYVGFKQAELLYDRDSRFAGKGNYNRLLGSLRIGLNGVLGFSKYPLHIISIIGFVISFGSFMMTSIYFILRLFKFDIMWGNPTLVMIITFLSGIQLMSLGIMGQYFARIYDEIQGRPLFIVESSYGFNKTLNRK